MWGSYSVRALSIVGLTCLMTGCSSRGRAKLEPVDHQAANDGSSLFADLRSEPKGPPSQMTESVVDIHAEGTVSHLLIRFRGRDVLGERVRVSVPLISGVIVGFPGSRDAVCAVQGRYPIEMTEWQYGVTPRGFEKVGCGTLTPGHYAVSVRSRGAGGVIGIAVNADGSVTPWPLADGEALWDGK
jgi:hypothetical protein